MSIIVANLKMNLNHILTILVKIFEIKNYTIVCKYIIFQILEIKNGEYCEIICMSNFNLNLVKLNYIVFEYSIYIYVCMYVCMYVRTNI
jgi:hypothetical protein